MKGRDHEIRKIRIANRAAAVGRLMLGEFDDWAEFIRAANVDLGSVPRRQLKSGPKDIQGRLSPGIRRFRGNNFENMTEQKLAELCEVIEPNLGFEMPLIEFEGKFGHIKPHARKGCPPHSTVHISLWGLQFEFPERHRVADILQAVSLARNAKNELAKYSGGSHLGVVGHKSDVASLRQRLLYGSRTCVLCCFNLVESYLNGVAWKFSLDTENIESLSERKRKTITDSSGTSIRDKILKYPEIIAGSPLWNDQAEPVKIFLDDVKPFRDSIVHPSPFSVPEKFGGYDKLRNLYRIDLDHAERSAEVVCALICRVHSHLNNGNMSYPEWLQDLMAGIKKGEAGSN
ncbi:MAG: hypothetical protein HYU38_07770 [Candidatus Tectomicrobia bacterium]|nr:hypothetical protein [Candidatus Tectomicrobia bacterium]